MGKGMEKIVKNFGSMTVRSDEDVVYGPNTDESLTTNGMKSGDSIKLLRGERSFQGHIIRVIDEKICLVSRRFANGRQSKPYKAHVSAIKCTRHSSPPPAPTN